MVPVDPIVGRMMRTARFPDQDATHFESSPHCRSPACGDPGHLAEPVETRMRARVRAVEVISDGDEKEGFMA
jgi:hypothetical protein